ncbi:MULTISPECIES: maleylpyruvate isomerase N-terminal domain-containing protein [unclassified Frondihabitans]|uniref:maleylpyruvate isomerase N-terminal domain-containing protein n=1 Tax=unclassified Frondihabitans TaxID=2626248 RepID=UPI000F4F2D94|nr:MULTISPECIES: maleylpyruvate isomerase N-terminal domain-containing protein [unclassified Frondihabitans]RPE74226.1 mycothiol maleylpyruvate isomerase-like protein [Frondihabitans sp. PhB153]RPF02656.1 mycothiol maleylpyruvate isomerase-like protein [Frondihabitans sp. PhB161]
MTDATAFALTQQAFDAAAGWFEQTVDAIDTRADQWHVSTLGEWTVRDLVGHTSRALLTVEQYLRPGPSTSTASTSDYYQAVRESRSDPEAVAERGRQSAADLGDDAAGAVREVSARVRLLIAHQSADARVVTPVGEWTLAAYLPTRVFELAVHTADLLRATGLEDGRGAPLTVNRVALRVMSGLLADADDDDAGMLLASLTGRGSLSSGFSLL